jgi:hypothetical protein
MQKWEYRKIRFDVSGRRHTIVEDSAVGRLKAPNPFSMIDYLNELGEEGWEVVSIHNPSWIMYFLKRPKP